MNVIGVPDMNNRQIMTTNSLAEFLRRWRAANPQWAYETSTWPRRKRAAQDVAADLSMAMERK